jgi:hypothetical protein
LHFDLWWQWKIVEIGKEEAEKCKNALIFKIIAD